METFPSHVQSTSAVLSTLKVQSAAFTGTLSMRTMWEGKKTECTGTERRSNMMQSPS